ncbi:glycerol-3-phosphate dehydrogenase/oxidase [Allohahella marinimesophila]|uniref:Glycerol-3-phosphate dehydrogenase/oxidase n=1 Tax=Allohahella marinimesophila TaxID=1054972 RepID=A0ABP7NJI1_9GAMM
MKHWSTETRRKTLAAWRASPPLVDVLVVGGGITGAGVLREAARAGCSAILCEQHDFAWGTSSKSSKMVHGGLRYLGSGQLRLARESVSERERMLVEAAGLVEPLQFLMAHYKGEFPPAWLFDKLLHVYDRFARSAARQQGAERQHVKAMRHRQWSAAEQGMLATNLKQQGLSALTQFTDAVTDDARLVMRVLFEAQQSGVEAFNYLKVQAVARADSHNGGKGRIEGAWVVDTSPDAESDKPFLIRAKTVISATGAWADTLRMHEGHEASIRPLRGSHLVVPAWRFPVAFSVSYFHPVDKRPVFVFPWEGATVIGTTDLDHSASLQRTDATDIAISEAETAYMLSGVDALFPGVKLARSDIISSWSGVRPVIASGEAIDPSKENREHAIWDDNGLITIAGGKLTTFRLIALDALAHAAKYTDIQAGKTDQAIFDSPDATILDAGASRLYGRYGTAALLMKGSSDSVGNTAFQWCELEWALKHEAVFHLDDLLLRRTRLGNLLDNGGTEVFDRLEPLCKQHLNWGDARWRLELERYHHIYSCYFSIATQAASASSPASGTVSGAAA